MFSSSISSTGPTILTPRKSGSVSFVIQLVRRGFIRRSARPEIQSYERPLARDLRQGKEHGNAAQRASDPAPLSRRRKRRSGYRDDTQEDEYPMVAGKHNNASRGHRSPRNGTRIPVPAVRNC